MVRSESQESLPLNLNRELVLFIQMEICGLTLSDWIKKRNENLNGNVEYVNIDEAHSAFLDILYGLEYIHSKGCIHRYAYFATQHPLF